MRHELLGSCSAADLHRSGKILFKLVTPNSSACLPEKRQARATQPASVRNVRASVKQLAYTKAVR